MEKLFRFFAVLKHGESLLHAETWKNVQLATAALIALIGFALTFVPDLQVSDSDIVTVAKAIAIIVGIINAYLTVATTTKIGITVSTTVPVSESDELPIAEPEPAVLAENSLGGGAKALSGK